MGLFDFLFEKPKPNKEDFHSVSEAPRFRANGSGTRTSFEDWNCGDSPDNISSLDRHNENDYF